MAKFENTVNSILNQSNRTRAGRNKYEWHKSKIQNMSVSCKYCITSRNVLVIWPARNAFAYIQDNVWNSARIRALMFRPYHIWMAGGYSNFDIVLQLVRPWGLSAQSDSTWARRQVSRPRGSRQVSSEWPWACRTASRTISHFDVRISSLLSSRISLKRHNPFNSHR